MKGLFGPRSTTSNTAETVSTTAATGPPVTAPVQEPASIAEGSNALAFDLYRKLRDTPGNVAFSPASISSALAMTWGGARGETAAQMKKALRFPCDPDSTFAEW